MILRVYWQPEGPATVVMQVYVGHDGADVNELIPMPVWRIPGGLFADLMSGNVQPEFFDARNMGGPPKGYE